MRWFLGLGLLVLGVGCQAPVIITGERTNLEAQFLIQGFPEASPAPAVSEEGPTSRLLIAGQADKLTVTITPLAAGLSTPSPQVIPISGSTAVTVVFPDIILGLYQVDAVATLGTVEKFRRSTKVNLSSTNMEPVSFSLAAVPNAGDLTGRFTSVLVPMESAVTYRIPLGSAFWGDGFYVVADQNSALKVFPQTSDGNPMTDKTNAGAYFINSAGSKSWYLTIYNSSKVDNLSVDMGSISFIQVPAGKFQRDAGSINISSVDAFQIGTTEVTASLWNAVMGHPRGAYGNYPVTNVSWNQAVDFCNQLGAALGRPAFFQLGLDGSGNQTTAFNWTSTGIRLPTEMEWLWAAMGAPADGQNGGTNITGYSKPFSGYFPGALEANFAWIGGKTNPTTVAFLNTNEIGGYDFSGNADEMVLDSFSAAAGIPSGPLTNYCNQTATGYIVTKGGAYSFSSCLLTARQGFDITVNANPAKGFRLARSITPR